jgi:hypothetical protein
MAKFKLTFSEMLAKAKSAKKPRKRPDDEEHRIQCACVEWFRLQYPQYAHNLFSIPNGGKRDKATAGKLKAEGALAGVADLQLARHSGQYGALFIEMKTRTGRQADTQRNWQQLIEKDGYKYVICRSLSEFMEAINDYLHTSDNAT